MLVVKQGKWRPIAIGMSLVCACGKVICHQLKSSIATYLTTTRLDPHQSAPPAERVAQHILAAAEDKSLPKGHPVH